MSSTKKNPSASASPSTSTSASPVFQSAKAKALYDRVPADVKTAISGMTALCLMSRFQMFCDANKKQSQPYPEDRVMIEKSFDADEFESYTRELNQFMNRSAMAGRIFQFPTEEAACIPQLASLIQLVRKWKPLKVNDYCMDIDLETLVNVTTTIAACAKQKYYVERMLQLHSPKSNSSSSQSASAIGSAYSSAAASAAAPTPTSDDGADGSSHGVSDVILLLQDWADELSSIPADHPWNQTMKTIFLGITVGVDYTRTVYHTTIREEQLRIPLYKICCAILKHMLKFPVGSLPSQLRSKVDSQTRNTSLKEAVMDQINEFIEWSREFCVDIKTYRRIRAMFPNDPVVCSKPLYERIRKQCATFDQCFHAFANVNPMAWIHPSLADTSISLQQIFDMDLSESTSRH